MKGEVFARNKQNGMLAIRTEEGVFSIIEPMGDDFELGDKVNWSEADDYPLGAEYVRNLTKDERVEVYFQNHCVTRENLEWQLGVR